MSSPSLAPDFTLDHIEGGSVSLHDYRGRPVILAFASREAAQEMRNQIDALRTRFDHEQLPVLSIADMRGVPRPARPVAKRLLKSSYNDSVKAATKQLEAQGKRVPPAPQLVIMLADWEGSVVASYGVAEDKEGTMVLVDGDGYARASGRGVHAAQQIMAALGG
jgi:hypothetical protein